MLSGTETQTNQTGLAAFPQLRLLLPIAIAIIYWADPTVRPVMHESLADAYVAVGVFVAITLFLYYLAEKKIGFDISKLSEQPAFVQISVAAILGALPGCGGAIIVVSQYAAGQVGFAALVAVLVATMGDAAFLLLAKAPEVGFMVIALGIVVGIASGLVVHAIHAPDFLRRPVQYNSAALGCAQIPPLKRLWGMAWIGLVLLVAPFTLLSSFQIELAPLALLGYQIDMTIALGVFGTVVCVLMWAMLPLQNSYRSLVAEDNVALPAHAATSSPARPQPNMASPMVAKVVHDTNFVMAWVAVAFLAFELVVHYTGLDIGSFFNSAAWLAPLIGVLVGFLPGCGPQIIIASLYLQGIAPLSTLLGNAVSNDGDALFPAIALSPKAAIYATVYSAIPALIVGYAVFWWVG